MSKLIFGCGYLGSRVAQRWFGKGETIHVVTRSAERANAFHRDGWHAPAVNVLIADVTKPESLVGLPPVSTVLFAVGLDRSTADTIENVYVNGLRNVLSALSAQGCSLKRFIYISSIGVYGQADGTWVDEQSVCIPTRDGGRACLAAESLLAADPIGEKTVILRLAGIYGPGRVPRKRDLAEQNPMPVADGYLNLIHVEDAADIVLAAEAFSHVPLLEQPDAGVAAVRMPATFVVADGNPVKRRTYYRELARLLNLPEPKFCDPADTGQPIPSRRMGNKRARIDRLMTYLKPSLNYPSYRDGLAAIFGEVDTNSVES